MNPSQQSYREEQPSSIPTLPKPVFKGFPLYHINHKHFQFLSTPTPLIPPHPALGHFECRQHHLEKQQSQLPMSINLFQLHIQLVAHFFIIWAGLSLTVKLGALCLHLPDTDVAHWKRAVPVPICVLRRHHSTASAIQFRLCKKKVGVFAGYCSISSSQVTLLLDPSLSSRLRRSW